MTRQDRYKRSSLIQVLARQTNNMERYHKQRNAYHKRQRRWPVLLERRRKVVLHLSVADRNATAVVLYSHE